MAPGQCFRNRTRFCLTSTSIPTRSPRAVLVTCMRGLSMVRGFVSNAYECTPNMARKKLLKYVVKFATSLVAIVNDLADLLSGGGDVETLDTSQHFTSSGCHCQPLPAHFELDARRRPTKLPQEESRRGSSWTCKFSSSPASFIPCSLLSPAVRCSRGPLLPPFVQRGSWGSQGSTWFWNPFSSLD